MKTHIFHLISILFLSAGITVAEEAGSSTRWEYKIWVQPDDVNEISGRARIEKELNNLGGQGWELVSVMWKKHSDRTSPQGRAIHYFKRRLPSEQGEKTTSKTAAEQNAAMKGQPAARSHSNSDGSDKPQPEAEGRSR